MTNVKLNIDSVSIDNTCFSMRAFYKTYTSLYNNQLLWHGIIVMLISKWKIKLLGKKITK